MALISRITPAPPAPPVAASRGPAASSKVANSESTAVEELSPSVGVSFSNSSLVFQEQPTEDQGERDRRPRTDNPYGGVSTPTQVFVSLLEVPARAATGPSQGVRATRDVATAIGIYETNARVISGTEEAPGGTINVNL